MSKQSISEINGEDSDLEGISLISDALESETSVPNQLPDGETSGDDDCDAFESRKFEFKLPKLVLAPNINRIGTKKDTNSSNGSTTSSSSSLSTSTSGSSSSTIMVERKKNLFEIENKNGTFIIIFIEFSSKFEFEAFISYLFTILSQFEEFKKKCEKGKNHKNLFHST